MMNEMFKRMAAFEDHTDYCLPPETFIVARLDGHNFSNLTKRMKIEKPFDVRFRDLMVATTTHVMKNTPFVCSYGYTESDEISLLLRDSTHLFGRRIQKYTSLLAGMASAFFTHNMGGEEIAAFDCRVMAFPREDNVQDYFLSRMKDSERNALNGWCYYTVLKETTADQARGRLYRMSAAQQHDLLFRHGINYNNIDAWQKRGVGIVCSKYEKVGFNPVSGQEEIAIRSEYKPNFDLPYDASYKEFIKSVMESK